MTERMVLNYRRQHDAFDFVHGGVDFTCTFSLFPNGAPAEVFLQCGKPNSERDVAAKDGAIVASIALQFGVPLNVLRHALQRTQAGEAAGALCRALDIIAAGDQGGI